MAGANYRGCCLSGGALELLSSFVQRLGKGFPINQNLKFTWQIRYFSLNILGAERLSVEITNRFQLQ